MRAGFDHTILRAIAALNEDRQSTKEEDKCSDPERDHPQSLRSFCIEILFHAALRDPIHSGSIDLH